MKYNKTESKQVKYSIIQTPESTVLHMALGKSAVCIYFVKVSKSIVKRFRATNREVEILELNDPLFCLTFVRGLTLFSPLHKTRSQNRCLH